jgi:hypothetical protein
LNFLEDGQHEAVYVARGACRDVYRIGETIVLKIFTHDDDNNPVALASWVIALRTFPSGVVISAPMYTV